MAFKVQVGPPQVTIHQGQTVLVTGPDGQIDFPSDRGLYFLDTRLVSSWSIYANGVDWDLLSGGAITYYSARIHHTNRAILTGDGPVPARTLGLTLGRHLSGGMHEDVDITNHGRERVRFNLEISIRADFADIFEVKANRIIRRGHITSDFSEPDQRLRLRYRNQDFNREVWVSCKPDGAPTGYANGRLTFEVDLLPAQSWHCCLRYELRDAGRVFAAPAHCFERKEESSHAESLSEWRKSVLSIRTSNEEFYRCFDQGVMDMAALRLPLLRTDHLAFVPAAGLPWFVALFGRDTLIASMQTLIVYPDFARGALEVLGALQANERDDYRDAEPGKILHELRSGELAHFKLIPHTPYYGTADATPLYLVALHATWRATGNRALLEQLLPVAEGCLRWIDESGDRDGDGFQEYQTRSKAGYENLGWKDSPECVVHPDGSLVEGPKALCELQGYVYDAWLRMAEIYDALDQPARAQKLREKAAVLHQRFNEVFWDEEDGFYAFTLDGKKRPVFSVASNPGHLLWSGLVPKERAARVVQRLTAKDMWTGWGIRTLSADNPAFNPYNYQTGSVWPHDNSIIALGFRRYGFAAEAAAVAHDISKAASHFLLNQLPELYAGIERTEGSFPVQHLGANVPQAWAAAAPFMLLQAMLGIQQDAPRGKLYIDPALPKWMPDVTLHNLRLGEQSFDLRFVREGEQTRWEVLRGDAGAVVRRDFGEACALPLR